MYDEELTVDNEEVTASEEKQMNAALMSREEFSSFIKSNVSNFLASYNLQKITVDVGNGMKGSVKINKNGEYETEVTFKEIV